MRPLKGLRVIISRMVIIGNIRDKVIRILSQKVCLISHKKGPTLACQPGCLLFGND